MRQVLRFITFALALCVGTAYIEPLQRAAQFMSTAFERSISLFDTGVARLKVTLAQWRTGSQATDESLKSNLMRSSNHFVMYTGDKTFVGPGLARC